MKLWLSNNVLIFHNIFLQIKWKEKKIKIWFSNFRVDQKRISLQVSLFMPFETKVDVILKNSMKLWLSNNVLIFHNIFLQIKWKEKKIKIWFSNFRVDQKRISLQVSLFMPFETVILSWCFLRLFSYWCFDLVLHGQFQ